jgi:hypothetical protein
MRGKDGKSHHGSSKETRHIDALLCCLVVLIDFVRSEREARMNSCAKNDKM